MLFEIPRVGIGKYIPHTYEWKYWDPKEKMQIKKGKKQKAEIECAFADLRHTPFLLKDCDIIGIRNEDEEGAAEDDFQTPEDELNRQRFIEMKAEQQKTWNSKKGAGGKKGNDEPAFHIYADF